MPFGTWVPSDEADAPQRNALQRLLSAMPEPGLVQQAGMLKDRLASLGPIQAAQRTADDLGGLFRSLGPISLPDLANPATLGQRAGAAAVEPATRALAPVGAALDRFDAEQQAGLEEGYARFKTPSETREQAIGRGERMMELGTAVAMGGPDTSRLIGAAGRGLRGAAGAITEGVEELGARRGQRGVRVAPLTPEQQAARAADMAAEADIFGGIQSLWKQGRADEADDLRLLAMGKGRQGLDAMRSYLADRGLDVSKIGRAASEAFGPAGVGARAAETGGERAFDLAVGTAGGIAGAATAPEDATWQERAGRFAVGAALGAPAGASARALARGARSGASGVLYGPRGETLSAVEPPAPTSALELPAHLRQPVQRAARAAAQAAGAPAQASAVEKILAVTINNMFTPGTVGVNVAGNTIQTFARPLRELLEARPNAAWADLAAMAREAPGAAARGARVFARGKEGVTGPVAQGMMEAAGRPEAFPGRAGALLTPIARANQGLDEFYRSVNAAGAGAALKAMGKTPEEAAPLIAQAAATSVFQGPPSQLTKFIGSVGRATEGNPVANALWQASVYAFFPFARTTEQIAGQTVRTLASPATGTVRMLTAAAKRDPEAFREAFAKWAMGMAVWGGAIALARGGNLTGIGVGSPAETALARNARDAQGNPITQPNSTRIAGRWFPNDVGGVWGLAAADIASLVEGYDTPGRPGEPPPELAERAQNAMNNLGRQLSRQFYLDDFIRFAGAVQEGRGVQAAGQAAGDLAGRAVPGLVTQAGQLGDPVVRDPQNPLEAVAARIPGLSGSVQPKIDPTTGEPITRGNPDVLSVLLRSPTRGAPNPVAAEVARLEAAGFPVAVRQLPREVRYAGAAQTPQQRRVLAEEFGRAANTYVRAVTARPDYTALTPEQQAATLNRALTAAYQYADLKAGDRVARDPAARAELAWARTPQYRGVEGGPDAVAIQNLQIREAKALLAEYRQRYGGRAGDVRMLEEDEAAYLLARTPELPEKWIALERERVRREAGATASRERNAPLLGAGNRPAFTAP